MPYTTTHAADSARLLLTLVCVVVVIVLACWAITKSLQKQAVVSSVPVLTVHHDQALPAMNTEHD